MASLSTLSYSAPQAEPSSERERLILEHLPQVRWVATRIHEKLPDSTSLEDLISIGIVGLINAIDNFDPQFNVKLKTYAEHKIRGAILDSIRGMDGIPAHKRKHLKQIQATVGVLEQRLQRAPGEEEIAAELGITPAGLSGSAAGTARGQPGQSGCSAAAGGLAQPDPFHRHARGKFAGASSGALRTGETDRRGLKEDAARGRDGAGSLLPPGTRHPGDRAHFESAHHARFPN